MTKKNAVALTIALAMGGFGCNGENSSGPVGSRVEVPSGIAVSNPLATSGSVSSVAISGYLSVSAETIAYVSAAPETFSGSASAASLRNETRNGAEKSIQLLDGGFDPVGVVADPGDDLELIVFTNGAPSAPVMLKVPPRRPPEVVRTNPKKGRTDVALNVQVLVVFSELVNKATVTSTSLTLTLLGNTVKGSVRVADDGLSAEFVADNSLQPLTTYVLVAGKGILDLNGEALNDAAEVTFTTEAGTTPGTIAFVSESDGNSEIYTIRTDGTGLVRLTDNAAADLDPAWSPDGNRIAFTSDRDGHLNIYVMNADGSNVVRLTSAGGLEPAWSPDGKKIAFTRFLNGGYGIATATIGGTVSESGLGRVPGVNSQPAWSPDGSRIAFVNSGDYNADVLIAKADGSGSLVEMITPPVPYRTSSYPAWSPDGQRMATVICDYDMGRKSVTFDPCHSKLAVTNLDGAGFTILWLTGDIPLHSGMVAPQPRPAWSPDGRILAVTSICAGGACPSFITLVSAEGVGLRNLVFNAHSPSWRP